MQTKKQNTAKVLTLLLVLAGVAAIVIVYFFFFDEAGTPKVTIAPKDQQVQMLQKQGTTDDVNSIETDLNSTNVDSLDQGIEQVNQDQTSLQ